MFKIQFTDDLEGYIDIKDGTYAPFNFGVAEIRDASTRKGVFSKTITLEGTKNNAKQLNSRFDVNILDSTFDVNKRVDCIASQNGVPIGENMYFQLTSVKVTNGIVEFYNGLIKDGVADLFTVINNRQLTDLDFSDFDHVLTAANVIATFPNTSGYKYHLSTNSDNIFTLNQFKPAIFGFEYLDRIIRGAGFEWDWVDYDNATTQFDKYIHPAANIKKTELENSTQVEATLTTQTNEPTFNDGFITGVSMSDNFNDMVVDTEVFDPFSLYDPITGLYTSNLNYQNDAALTYRVKANVELRYVNNSGSKCWAKMPFGSSQSGNPFYYNIIFPTVNVSDTNTGTVKGISPQSGSVKINAGTSIEIGEDKLIGSTTLDVSINCTNILELDELITKTGAKMYANNRALVWTAGEFGNLPTENVTTQLVYTNIEVEIYPNSGNGYAFGQVIRMNDFVPRKKKQGDYIKDIILMNNLWIDTDKDNPKKIIFHKRNDYLDAGTVKDWSKKIDLEKGTDLKFLPNLSKKKIVFKLKNDKDILNESYEDAVNEVYGQAEYTYKSDFVKGIDVKEVKFSPTPLHELGFGAIVPALDGSEPSVSMRVLLSGEVNNIAPYFIDEGGGVLTEVTTYPFVGHFDNPINPTLDINFAICDYYFYDKIERLTNNTLFNLNWARYTAQIDNGQLLTAYVYLNEFDIQTFKPNDKIWINDKYWYINKIIDYNANARQLTKVEFIPIDLKSKVPFTTTKPVKPVKPNGNGNGTRPTKPVHEWIRKVTKNANKYLINGSTEIVGKNNTILTQDPVLVVGDNIEVKSGGVWTEVINFPSGGQITGEGFIGTSHNLISAGEDQILNEFSTSIINLVTAGKDAVRGLGSNTPINKIKS